MNSRLTKMLLFCGTLTGPLFFAVAIIQALTRPGFNVRLNALSQLSLGDLGWIQVVSFLLTGLLALACAIGVRRLLKGQKGGTWGALLVGTFGLGLLVAGIFRADPGFGFPPGAPEGPAMPMSGHATLHAVGFFLSMLSLIVNCFVFVRRFGSTGQRGWLVYSVVSAVAFGWVSAVAAGLRLRA
jgi:uncharacterized membrane protein YhaH (DUF805 family)